MRSLDGKHEFLVMAMTYMRGGICTAGFIEDPDTTSGLRWVRPVKPFGALLIGDMTDTAGRVIQMGDVVTMNLVRPEPKHVHSEDWLTDFVRQRPRQIRQLTGQKRADFLIKQADQQPGDVLHGQIRSLCLLQPEALWANFSWDAYTQNYAARIGFQLGGKTYPEHNPQRGIPVTDLKWRALGRSWLTQAPCQHLYLDHAALLARLHADTIHLSIGLSRQFEEKIWQLVIGVHPIPDYAVKIDYNQL